MTARLAFLLLASLGAALPFGVIVTTLFGGDVDIRAGGSGNIGATNVVRLYGWRLGGWAVALDVAKGFVPVLLARLMWPDEGIAWGGIVALWCFLAHCFPVYLEFRGGKGVATGAGGMLALSPQVTVLAAGVWVTLLAATGRSSIAALGSVLSVVGLAWWLHPALLPIVGLFALGVVATHTPNIRRLLRGEEAQVVRPVRWKRASEERADVDQALSQGPGGGPAPSVWRESEDPLE
jgi:acyl phosphate:glycerol-3-phosphate acyltransferase